jgi:hypothetical protein
MKYALNLEAIFTEFFLSSTKEIEKALIIMKEYNNEKDSK